MRFLLALALFSIPLVYAGLSELGGISYLITQQRLGKIVAANQSPANLLKSATITNADQVDDSIGLVSSSNAVPVPDPASAFVNSASEIFANAQPTEDDPLETNMKREAAIEDAKSSRLLTSTSNEPNPEEIIGLGVPGDKDALLSKAIPLNESKINIGADT